MGKKNLIVILIFAVLCAFVMPVNAWGTSANVVAVDDQSSCSGGVCSDKMGKVNFADYSQSFTRVPYGSLDKAALTGKDTLLFFGLDPSLLSASQKSDVVDFVASGGKLIIWDGEDACNTGFTCDLVAPGHFDYSWLGTFTFSSYAPGAWGSIGKPLVIVEDNQLSSTDSGSPYYINTTLLSADTDAVGDSNVFTTYDSSHWCLDMTATNVLNFNGPTHLYTKDFGNGIVIYSGLDWNYAKGGLNGGTIAGQELNKMLQNELNANNLPCYVIPTPLLEVTKNADKSCLTVGETINFTIVVTNPATNTYTSTNTVIVDTPPAEITCPSGPISVGDLAPGQSATQTLECTAVSTNINAVKNSATATGYYLGLPLFTGTASKDFQVSTTCKGTPEFPTIALPAMVIAGIMGVIVMLKRKEE
ncbi:MAG TPA: hypothetical protein PKM50_05980 [Methanoregula sp.]|nr:hypothetical protein [Methanoregula sp.]